MDTRPVPRPWECSYYAVTSNPNTYKPTAAGMATAPASTYAPSAAAMASSPPIATATPIGTAAPTTPVGTPTPANAGTAQNLPQHIRDAATLHGQPVIIAWTQFDPALEKELGRYSCFSVMAPFFPLLLPCFWIHFCCLAPCIIPCALAGKAAIVNGAKSQYWILTDRELKIVSLDHDVWSCAGWSKTGNIVKTVPLEQITDCGLDARGNGKLNQMAGDLPTIYVDTASSGANPKGPSHEAVGLGLEHYAWFLQQLQNQRNTLQGAGAVGAASIVSAIMSRPPGSITHASTVGGSNNKTTAERLAEIKQLKDQEIISQAEYDQKRQQIIAGI